MLLFTNVTNKGERIMRNIRVESAQKGIKYPIVTAEEIVVTPKQLRKIAKKKLMFNDDLSALVPYQANQEETLLMENAEIKKQLKLTEKWLDLYDKQVAEHNRCKRLGVVYDNKYGTIEALDNQAVEKVALLNQYREKLTQNTTQLRMLAEQRRIEQAQKLKEEKAATMQVSTLQPEPTQDLLAQHVENFF